MNPLTGRDNSDPVRPRNGQQGHMSEIEALIRAVGEIYRPLVLVRRDDEFVVAHNGVFQVDEQKADTGRPPVAAYAPPCRLKDLGDPDFCDDYRIEYPYLLGSMANGISSVRMVEAAARAGMLGFFGAAGLSLPAVTEAVDRINSSIGNLPFGFNLIHSPGEPALEAAVADLYLKKGVRLIEASAFMDLTLPLVRYRVSGIHQSPDGSVVTPNRIIAKASRVEVAARFFSPPPERFLRELVAAGEISDLQARLAAGIPMARDLTVEADSGGHTDNAPAITLFPTMLALRERLQARYNYHKPLRLGAAGGIATPVSALAAFSMGAAYVLTGSINQSALEAGTSPVVREMLAKCGQADIIMAPAADMFEMGVKVQVLKWGTMFAMRASKLHHLYRSYDSLEAVPPAEIQNLEKNFFRQPLKDVWQQTRAYFLERDRDQIDRAAEDPKHRMALIFRWYLGQASNWANAGEPSRKIDYQIFCGPAMGAFNEWTTGSFLEKPEHRDVTTIALNILYGAAVLTRINILRRQGVALPLETSSLPPLTLEEIKERLK